MRNLEESTEFYCDNFGLKVIQEYENSEKGWEARLLQGGSANIELFEFKETANTNNNKDMGIVGIKHIALAVTDLDSEVKRLSHLKFEPIRLGVSGKRFTFTEDPNGVQIELYEVAG